MDVLEGLVSTFGDVLGDLIAARKHTTDKTRFSNALLGLSGSLEKPRF